MQARAEPTTALTFDVYSALIDSRTGGTTFFARLVASRSWAVSATDLYDRWDSLNKRLHRQNEQWVPFSALARRALAMTYRELALPDTAADDSPALLASMAQWPRWPDVSADTLATLSGYRLGLLTNIDDALLERASALPLEVFDPALVWTSERAGAYKPSSLFYQRARRGIGPLVHVASSARDVRGSLDAGIVCVRLRRPGHDLDPQGPRPRFEAAGFGDLPGLVERAAAEA